jgi:uncharacterized protein (DUF952 family)
MAQPLRSTCTMTLIYKISPRKAWTEAEAKGIFEGAPIDFADGFIHFSAAHQVRETAEKYFSNTPGLVLAAIDTASLGSNLKWEASRGGDLFPHLYGPLKMTSVVTVYDMPMDANGTPVLPEIIP